MTVYSINEFRPGLKIILEKEPCIIVESEFIKPGKGQVFSRVRLRKLISNKLLEKTFKSTDFLKSADIIDLNLMYLYNNKKFWYFMNYDNFEQFSVDHLVIADNKKWLTNQINCVVTFWNQKPIVITVPNFVSLEVVYTDPGLKGDTLGGGISGGKDAILITGVKLKVPLFIKIGDIIKVDTRLGEYVSRIK
ncbi:elongation factor P [Arsenophonus symbiont of Ornithomya chloropus]|uniref:elongation factor P n=1 Tax=Arsenophonus symbiont of Ornithomya chloropus TaxID=634121 RepID=UPI0032B28E2F